AGCAQRGGLQGRERQPGPCRICELADDEAARAHILQIRWVTDHATVRRERDLEHPCHAERDDTAAGRRSDGSPGRRLPPEQQADAADERPHRAALPQVLGEEEEEELPVG
ncbi:Os04g0412500, partial [Oryza sativa Japonica Group]